jgi:hypothetical protein
MFSMLWKALKKGPTASQPLTWSEMMAIARTVYMGWADQSPSATAIGKIQVSDIAAVWQFQKLFGLGAWGGKARRVRCTQNPLLKGLFGKGSDPELKPHRFEISKGQLGPEVTAYFTASASSAVFLAATPIFSACPDITTVGSTSLSCRAPEQMPRQRWQRSTRRSESAPSTTT